MTALLILTLLSQWGWWGPGINADLLQGKDTTALWNAKTLQGKDTNALKTFVLTGKAATAGTADSAIALPDSANFTAVNATRLYGDGSNITGISATAASALTFTAKVNEAAGIRKGQAVYLSGATGALPQVSLAINTVANKTRVIGLAAETKADNQNVLIRRAGVLSAVAVDTFAMGDTYTWTAGALLWLTSNPGKMSPNRPTSGRCTKIAYVLETAGSSDLLVVPLENPVWHTCAAGEDNVLRLGDTLGTNKASFRDYANVEKAYVNSDGVFSGIGSSLTSVNAATLQGKDTTALWNAKTLQGKDTTALYAAKTAAKIASNGDSAKVWTMTSPTTQGWAAGGGGATFTDTMWYTKQTLSIVSGHTAWNLALGGYGRVLMTSADTMNNPSNVRNGRTYRLKLVQDGTGTRLMAWGTNYRFPGSVAPTLTATRMKADIITFIGDEDSLLIRTGATFSITTGDTL